MNVTLLLADAAQSVGGKVYALGLGWNVTGTPTPPMAIVLMLDVGWDETNTPIAIHVELVDADGRPVTVPGPVAAQQVALDVTTEVGRPPGHPAVADLRIPIAIDVPAGLPLTHGQRYEWKVAVNGETEERWVQGFTVRG